MRTPSRVLVDTNTIIEAVRTGCWAAITGALRVETVEECRFEASSGSPGTIPGYVPVGPKELDRLTASHQVSQVMRARFKLAYPDAEGLDAGEHDLLAFARTLADPRWTLCSPDKAAIRATVALGLGDHIWSLEQLAQAAGVRPAPPLRRQYTTDWLVSFRTSVRLDLL